MDSMDRRGGRADARVEWEANSKTLRAPGFGRRYGRKAATELIVVGPASREVPPNKYVQKWLLTTGNRLGWERIESGNIYYEEGGWRGRTCPA